MRFKCPHCHTVYDIPGGKAEGAPKMRCSVCGNVWKIAIPEPEREAEPVEAQPDSIDPFADEIEGDFSRFIPRPKADDTQNIPDLDAFLETPFYDNRYHDRKNRRSALTFLMLGIFMLLSSAVLVLIRPVKDVPISFENVIYYFTEQDYKRFLNIDGALVNKARQPAEVPMFYIRFFNKSGVNIASQQIPAIMPPLKPHEVVPFALKIERPPATAETIELILKNTRTLKVFPETDDDVISSQTAMAVENAAASADVSADENN